MSSPPSAPRSTPSQTESGTTKSNSANSQHAGAENLNRPIASPAITSRIMLRQLPDGIVLRQPAAQAARHPPVGDRDELGSWATAATLRTGSTIQSLCNDPGDHHELRREKLGDRPAEQAKHSLFSGANNDRYLPFHLISVLLEEFAHRGWREEAKMCAVEDPEVLIVPAPARSKRPQDPDVANVRNGGDNIASRRQMPSSCNQSSGRVDHMLENVIEDDAIETFVLVEILGILTNHDLPKATRRDGGSFLVGLDSPNLASSQGECRSEGALMTADV